MIASFHGHEQGGDTLLTAKHRSDIEDIADYTLEYGRQCIEAGADIFVAHGPQSPMAVEVYNGASQIPSEFQSSLLNARCGVVVIWTRVGNETDTPPPRP